DFFQKSSKTPSFSPESKINDTNYSLFLNKPIKSLLYLALPLFLLGCSESTSMVEEVISEVQQRYRPDKRVAIFDVVAKGKAGEVLLKGQTNLPEAREQLLKELNAIGVNIMDSIQLLPHPDLEDKIYGVVNLSACNLRSNPKHSAELATQSTLGTPLKIYLTENDWYRVQTPDGYLGWLDPGGFIAMNKAQYNIWKLRGKVIYAKDFGFSYSKADSSSMRVSDLIAGNILALEGTEGNYFKVRYPDDRIAYISKSETLNYQDWLAQNPTAEQILQNAQQHLGRPYLWGGTSGKGMDCSGFTKTVFYNNGLMLPRDASQQVHVGIELKQDTTWQNLLPGDFLFFGRKATLEKKERITHVAIYMGDGKIIHSAGTVKIESLNRNDPDFAEDRFDTFVRAKRMLQNVGENGVIAFRELEVY
ncbi:MAG: C40 family peptidase, partial [Bacteroidota bacterium]